MSATVLPIHPHTLDHTQSKVDAHIRTGALGMSRGHQRHWFLIEGVQTKLRVLDGGSLPRTQVQLGVLMHQLAFLKRERVELRTFKRIAMAHEIAVERHTTDAHGIAGLARGRIFKEQHGRVLLV